MITLSYTQLALIIFGSGVLGAVMVTLFVVSGNAERGAEETERMISGGHF